MVLTKNIEVMVYIRKGKNINYEKECKESEKKQEFT